MNFYSTLLNWTPWPYRLSLCLLTDVPKRPLPSAVSPTTIIPITAILTRRSLNSITNNHETSIGTHDNISNSTQSSNVTPTRKRLRRKIKPTNIQLDHSSVINLSSYSLSTDETSVLARGLTFCPTPRHIDWPEVSADIYDFSRLISQKNIQ